MDSKCCIDFLNRSLSSGDRFFCCSNNSARIEAVSSAVSVGFVVSQCICEWIVDAAAVGGGVDKGALGRAANAGLGEGISGERRDGPASALKECEALMLDPSREEEEIKNERIKRRFENKKLRV